MANLISLSERVSDFVDAADVGGNLKNNSIILQYLNIIDNACIKAGVSMGAVYPFVGNNSISHSFNFLNPSQHQITWNGGITHSVNGIKGDGSTGFGNTNMTNGMFNLTNGLCISANIVDIGTNGTRCEVGVIGTGGAGNSIQFRTIYTGTNFTLVAYTSSLQASAAFGKNFYMANKVPSVNSRQLVLGSSNFLTSTIILSDVPVNDNIYILAANNLGTAEQFSNRGMGIVTITNGLDSSKYLQFSHSLYVAQRSINRI